MRILTKVRSFLRRTVREEWQLLLLFVLALALYIPGIWWGLPYAVSPGRPYTWASDGLAPLGPVAELYSVFISPDPVFNPQYPLFGYIMQAVLVTPYMLVLLLSGGLTQPEVVYPFGLTDPFTSLRIMTLLARTTSLLCAAGVVVTAYLTARTLWSRRAGLLAGIFVLLMYPMFYYGRTSNVDMSALFWTSLGLYIFAGSLKNTLTDRRAILLGLFAALATATKDASYTAFVPLALVLVPRQLRLHGSRSMRAWRPLLLLLASGTVAYLVASGLVFDLDRFRQHLAFITQGSEGARGTSYYSTPATLAGYLGLLAQAGIYVADALGWPMALLVPVGIAFCWRRTRPATGLLLAAAGMFVLVIIPVRFIQFRFVLISAYVLALFAACGASGLLAQSSSVWPKRLGAVWAILAIGWALVHGLDLTAQMLNDSRYEMATWFRQHAQEGEEIGFYGDPLKLPHLEPGIKAISMPGQIFVEDVVPADYAPEYVIIIPQQVFEPVHEYTMPEEVYAALDDGTMGYRRVAKWQFPSLFRRRLITFVNPPAQLFVREDLLQD